MIVVIIIKEYLNNIYPYGPTVYIPSDIYTISMGFYLHVHKHLLSVFLDVISIIVIVMNLHINHETINHIKKFMLSMILSFMIYIVLNVFVI